MELPSEVSIASLKLKTIQVSTTPKLCEKLCNDGFGHDEWRLPNLIVVDGATAQMNVAKSILEEFGYSIPVMAVTKNEYHKPKNIVGIPAHAGQSDSRKHMTHESDILLANSEAHRYAPAITSSCAKKSNNFLKRERP